MFDANHGHEELLVLEESTLVEKATTSFWQLQQVSLANHVHPASLWQIAGPELGRLSCAHGMHF